MSKKFSTIGVWTQDLLVALPSALLKFQIPIVPNLFYAFFKPMTVACGQPKRQSSVLARWNTLVMVLVRYARQGFSFTQTKRAKKWLHRLGTTSVILKMPFVPGIWLVGLMPAKGTVVGLCRFWGQIPSISSLVTLNFIYKKIIFSFIFL